MVWVYSIILSFSAGLMAYVTATTSERMTRFLGMAPLSHNVLSYAAIAVLAFLMVAQAPAMMLTCAAVLWFAGARHNKNPLGLVTQLSLLVLATALGIASLSHPNFALPPQLPKAAIMAAVYIIWLLIAAMPVGAPGVGLFAAYGVSLLVFVVGSVAFALPTHIASDAVILGGAWLGAYFGLSVANSHHGLGGQWVFLYLLGFLAASAAYAGTWWLGLLGMAPVCVYALIRKA